MAYNISESSARKLRLATAPLVIDENSYSESKSSIKNDFLNQQLLELNLALIVKNKSTKKNRRKHGKKMYLGTNKMLLILFSRLLKFRF